MYDYTLPVLCPNRQSISNGLKSLLLLAPKMSNFYASCYVAFPQVRLKANLFLAAATTKENSPLKKLPPCDFCILFFQTI